MEPLVLLDRRLGGNQSRMWWQGEKLLPLMGMKPQSSSPCLVTTWIEPSQIFVKILYPDNFKDKKLFFN
jgi:hypothetical protein